MNKEERFVNLLPTTPGNTMLVELSYSSVIFCTWRRLNTLNRWVVCCTELSASGCSITPFKCETQVSWMFVQKTWPASSNYCLCWDSVIFGVSSSLLLLQSSWGLLTLPSIYSVTSPRISLASFLNPSSFVLWSDLSGIFSSRKFIK